jgi:hypothetical protein
MFFAGLYLVNDAHEILPEWTIQEHALGMRAFYLGWIMLWISPVLGWLTYLGSDMGRGEWKTMVVGSGWLCIVDTYVYLCLWNQADVPELPFGTELGQSRKRPVLVLISGEVFHSSKSLYMDHTRVTLNF